MRQNFAQTIDKDTNDIKLEAVATQELTDAANAVRLILVKKEYVELLRKEKIGCLLATD